MSTFSRRDLLRMSAFSAVNAMAQSGASDYKAMVCVFLQGGNDGNNMVVPMTQTDFDAYRAIRGNLALPDNSARLLAVQSLADGKPYGLNDGLKGLHPLWGQGKLAVVANMGNLVKPTTRAEYLANAGPVPTNLFSHSDQTAQMQSGFPNSGAGTGWAGRVADAANAMNGAASFPASVSMSGPALFCTGGVVQSASLVPDYDLSIYGRSRDGGRGAADGVAGVVDVRQRHGDGAGGEQGAAGRGESECVVERYRGESAAGDNVPGDVDRPAVAAGCQDHSVARFDGDETAGVFLLAGRV